MNFRSKEYSYLHRWVDSKKGKPQHCVHCGAKGKEKTRYYWANVSGDYKKDVNDFIRLCSKCHHKFDKGLTKREAKIILTSLGDVQAQVTALEWKLDDIYRSLEKK